jgi:hypothetical protein
MMSDSRLAYLAAACKQVGLNPTDAVLLRYHVNAVYHLPHSGVVARMSPVKREEQIRRGVQVTRWLMGRGFPATTPLDIEQPVQVGDYLVTFWRYYDARGRSLPPPTDLARLLRQLHSFEPPPYRLPAYEPLAHCPLVKIISRR